MSETMEIEGRPHFADTDSKNYGIATSMNWMVHMATKSADLHFQTFYAINVHAQAVRELKIAFRIISFKLHTQTNPTYESDLNETLEEIESLNLR